MHASSLGRSAVSLLLLVPVSARSAAAQGCTDEPVPLIDLRSGTYCGAEGGLYTGGLDVPPPSHLAAALAEADLIEPLDANGQPNPVAGLIGFVNIGFSNPTHEWAAFERQEERNPFRSPRVSLACCSQGGQSAQMIRNPNANYWDLVLGRVAAAGLDPLQVQACWLKQAIAGPSGEFPEAALELQGALKDIVGILRDLFPNLRICYVSSRAYAGYTPGSVNPEPFAYEDGFAAKWLIEEQIAGEPMLNWDPARGPVESPLLLWGPYLWANGSRPRSDGFSWLPEDFEQDGDDAHPSPSGEQKVADLFSAFVAGDQTFARWYSGDGADSVTTLDSVADAHVDSSAPDTNFGAEDALAIQGAPAESRAFVRFDTRGLPRPFSRAELSFRVPTDAASGSDELFLVPDVSWEEARITWNTQPSERIPLQPTANVSRDGALSLDVTSAVNADADGRVGFALTKSGTPAQLLARESGQPPRLVLSLSPPGIPYCFCDGSGAPAPCGNSGDSGRGCANSVGAGARMAASGSASVSDDALGFQCAGLAPNEPTLLLAATGPEESGAGAPFGDGLRCIAGLSLRAAIGQSNAAGTASFGPGIAGQGDWRAGALAYFQVRYRDASGSPCGTGFNLTNGVRVAFAP